MADAQKTEEEEKAANKLAPSFTNRFFVRTGTLFTRISFGEDVLGDINYHLAITMPTADARLLAELILDLLKKLPSPPAGPSEKT